MYFVINNHLTLTTEKIYTKNGIIAKVRELYSPADTLAVPSDYFKEYLGNHSVHSSFADATIEYIVENCMNSPYEIVYNFFSIKCVKEYQVEGIDEQFFELDELAEPVFYYDHDFTFNMAVKWFKTTPEGKVMEDNPLGIKWERVVRQDCNVGNFGYEYSDELVNLYIDAALEKISQMSKGDMMIINDLKITCH